jgi:tol-pal system protein YbgF
MSSRFQILVCAVLACAAAGLSLPASAQQDDGDVDPGLRIERLESQLRQLTGQNEELQHRNRMLEEQLRQLQGGAQPAPGAQAGPQTTPRANSNAAPGMAPNVAGAPVVQPNVPYQQPQGQQPNYNAQAPAPMIEPQGAGGRRGDAFDPNRNPNAPGVPRALGGGQLPMSNDGPVGAPGGRGAGEPLDLSGPGGRAAPAQGYPQQGYPQQQGNAGGGLTTLPPSATPKDEFDLGIGYIQRKDYALAEETMRNFAQKYPSDRLTPDAQYWLGESMFQRQKYREAAEAFLAVTTKYDKSAKAPDALLRLGQSLAALKEKEAACAAFGEITRKYPRASSGVKQGVAREQKRIHC